LLDQNTDGRIVHVADIWQEMVLDLVFQSRTHQLSQTSYLKIQCRRRHREQIAGGRHALVQARCFGKKMCRSKDSKHRVCEQDVSHEIKREDPGRFEEEDWKSDSQHDVRQQRCEVEKMSCPTLPASNRSSKEYASGNLLAEQRHGNRGRKDKSLQVPVVEPPYP